MGDSVSIIAPNDSASNGIVHAINAVILPVNLELAVEWNDGRLDRQGSAVFGCCPRIRKVSAPEPVAEFPVPN